MRVGAVALAPDVGIGVVVGAAQRAKRSSDISFSAAVGGQRAGADDWTLTVFINGLSATHTESKSRAIAAHRVGHALYVRPIGAIP